jgi:hypothetical protein
MKKNKTIIDKLTALWALNESGLGGFMHVFNSPFTGLIVGGIAILLISLIAYYAEDKWQSIMKALVVVLIIKIAVSPHSPFTAYISVSFQAVFGALLFTLLSWRGVTLVILGLVTYLQSALQKLLVLTVVYGTNIWEAVDIYGAWIQDKLNYVFETSTTTILISIFLMIYGMGGIAAGLFIRSIIRIIANRSVVNYELSPVDLTDASIKKRKINTSRVIWIWLIIVAIIVGAFALFGGPLFGWQKALYIMLRSFLVLILWYWVLGPFVLKYIRRYLNKKESNYKEDITNAMDLFPYFRYIIAYTWTEVKKYRGFKRFKYFVAYSISNCIHFKIINS